MSALSTPTPGPPRSAVVPVAAAALAVTVAVLFALLAVSTPRGGTGTAPAAGSADGLTGETTEGATVELAPIVDAWPDVYTTTGTKSEPLYVEHITSTRDGDIFALRIEVVAQGDAALGTQLSAVRVGTDGRIEWLAGCTKSATACADDPALRGFLSAATIRSALDRGSLPATATTRTLHGTAVVCIADRALHPAAPPAAIDLQPCFSRSTGAMLGHYSDASAAFVGATLAAGFVDTPHPDPDLIGEFIS